MGDLEREIYRPTWDEYFMLLAKLASTRSTCLAFPVGAVIVKDRQVLATGYNGAPLVQYTVLHKDTVMKG